MEVYYATEKNEYSIQRHKLRTKTVKVSQQFIIIMSINLLPFISI